MKKIVFLLVMLLASCTTTSTTDANNMTGTWNGTAEIFVTLYYQAVFTDTDGTVTGKNFNCEVGFTKCVAKVSFSGTRKGTDLSLTVTDIDTSDGTNPPESATGTVVGNKFFLTSAKGNALSYTKKQ
jgi:hypothetical protein